MRRNISLPRPLNRQRTAQRVLKAAIVTTAILSGPIYAQTINWDAEAADLLWTSANNWAGNVLPGVNSTPVFNLNATTTISLNGTTQTVAGLSFNQGSVYTLTNGSLILNSLAQTVNVNNLIQVPITTKNSGGDVLTANVTTNTLSLQRAVTSGGITKTGNGTLRLGTNTTDFNGAINGNIVVSGGTLAAFAAGTAGSNNPLAGSTGNITIGAANVTVSLNHDMTPNSANDDLDTYDFARDIVANNNSFTLNVDRSGTIGSGGVSQAGILTIGNATMTVTGNNAFKARLDGVKILSGSTTILNVNNNGGNSGANNLQIDSLEGDETTVLRKNGGQTLTITELGTSDFKGRIELNGGTMTLRGGANVPTAKTAGITFISNTTLNLRADANVNFVAPITFGPDALAQTINVDRITSAGTTGKTLSLGTIDISNGRTLTASSGNSFVLGTPELIISAGTGTLNNTGAVTTPKLTTAPGTVFNKTGGGTLTISQNNSTSSSAPINLKAGTITATAAGALGTGLVTVGNSANTAGFIADLPRLNWNVTGASANGTGVDAIAKAGGLIDLNATPAATDVFEIEGDGRIQGTTAQLQALTVGTNVTLAQNAIIAHENPNATATATITGLSNNANLYYGIAVNNANTVPAIGVGTPWKGIANADETGDRTIQGANLATPATININGGDNDPTTIEATFQSLGNRTLNFGTTTSTTDGEYRWSSAAPGQKVTLAIRGALGTSNLGFVPGGRVSFNENAASTQLATAVDKIVVQSGTLGLYVNQALGGVPVEVQSGGALTVGSAAGSAIDGNVTINSGGVLNLSEGPLLTGSNTIAITIEGGGKLDISGTAPANILTASTQQITFNGSGHTVRIGANNIEELDQRVPDGNVTFVVASGVSQTTSFPDTNIGSTGTPLLVNTQSAGANAGLSLQNGTLTNGGSNAAYVGPLNLNGSNLTIAATRGTSFLVASDVSTGGDIQIGSLTAIDGRDKSSNAAATNWAGVADPYNSAAQVVVMGKFSANNVTVNNSHFALGNADSTIGGDLTINGGIFYADGGGPITGGQGQLTSKLAAGTLADRIILGPNSRVEMKLDLASDSNATTLVINQPFVIDGDINPQDNRRMWMSRNSGTNNRVDLADVTLREGSVFGVQMDNTSVRANLKLAGNATVSTSSSNNNLDYINVTRDGSLPAFDGSNPVVLTQGRLNMTGWQGSNTTTARVFGTIGSGVQIDLVRGQIHLQGGPIIDDVHQPLAILNGVVRAQTAVVGGDAFVVSTSGGNTNPTAVAGEGRIEIGRSAAANGPEDFEIQGTEIATGTSPLHTHRGEVRIVNDNDNTSIDGIVRSNRANDNTQPARVQADNVVLESGATVQLAAANSATLTVSAINLLGNGTINTAATGMTINAVNAGTNHVTFTGTQSPTINGPITAGEVTVTNIALNFPATLNSKLNVGGNNAAATVNGSVTNGLNVTGGNSTATIKGDVTGGLNVTVGTATFDGTGAPAGTRTVTGPVSLDAGAIAVTNGTLDLGNTVITSTPTQTVAGLREMKVSGAFNLTSANTSNNVKLGPVQAQLTTGWGLNETYIYSGQFFVPDNNGNGTGSFAFAENFDDSVRVMIDGTQRLSNGTHNDATGTGALTLPAGWHDVEFRFGQGTGGAGPFASEAWDGTLGFGLDLDNSTAFDPIATPVQAQYTAPLDNGSMNLFRTTVSSSLTVGAGSTLKAGGFTNVGKVSLTGANAKVTLDSASGPAVQSTADSIEVSAGASGNIEIVRAGDKLTVGGVNAQGGVTVSGGGDVTINGNVTGTAAFVHAGTGVLTVNGQMDAPTTVSSGGTVGGNATFNGGLTVTNGTLAPGLSPGLMTASTLTTDVNATFQLEIGGTQAGVTYDQIVITGNTVDINGSALSLSVTSEMHPNDVLTLILNNGTDTNVGAFAGIANGSFISLSGGYEVQISYFDDASVPGLQLAGGNDVSVVVTVPEPSAAVALLGGIATLISLSRFRRRNS